MSLFVLKHPLASINLTVLRDASTDHLGFRQAVAICSQLLCWEASKDLSLVECLDVRTPTGCLTGSKLGAAVGLAPILRSGLGMQTAALDLLPGSKVYHLGLFRDETTREPIEYYSKLPRDVTVDVVYLLDPLLATGNTALAGIQMLEDWGLQQNQIKLLTIIGSRAAVDQISAGKPGVQIVTCAVDEELTEKGYVIPGCGDVGDRLFGL